MSKRTNMGRASHRAQDAELNQTEPAKSAPNQATRPTQHPDKATERRKERPY
jgi:hypothetical protein